MNAADIMTPNVITVRPDTPLDAIVNLMLENRISGVPGVTAITSVVITSSARRPWVRT